MTTDNPCQRHWKYLDLFQVLFVASLVTANIIAVKLISIGPLVLPAAVIIFPISYIVGDVLTEVYGYSAARRVIWLGFGANLLVVLAIAAGGALPAVPFWNAGGQYGTMAEAQKAYQAILGFTPRLLMASFLAYLVGEFTNSFVLARMKVLTEGRYLWARTIGSTVVGQALDSTIFLSVAFAGILPFGQIGALILGQWFFKVAYETLLTPVTYGVVNFLKRVEGIDFYDRGTNFSPIRFEME
ncbi:MAG: queuosine precursor transporter [Deltaproteobacteria bacterium]|nr:queuosine precursor transporter [Deltaproteobacteria bacterium]